MLRLVAGYEMFCPRFAQYHITKPTSDNAVAVAVGVYTKELLKLYRTGELSLPMSSNDIDAYSTGKSKLNCSFPEVIVPNSKCFSCF
jgi:hypothetical protein